jgi:hypothetical protein
MSTLPNGGLPKDLASLADAPYRGFHRENGGPMKRFAPLLCVLASALIMVGGAQAGSEDDQGCASVHAVGVGQDLGGGSTTAMISRGGRLNGTTTGQFAISGAPPVFGIDGTVVFTTKGGTLTATVSGTFNVLTGEFTASGPVSAGTGNLAGTTGTLTFQGVENLATGVFTETITGTLCQSGD